MDSSRPPITDPEKISEQIVAYLDGELSTEGCQELEERLARDSEFRSQLNNYQETWELLDDLPTTTADIRFAASTIEMVAVVGNQDSAEDETEDGSFWVTRPWISVFLGIGLSLLVGFAVVRATAALLSDDVTQARENEQLLDDLPVIGRVDIYQSIDSIDFLRELAATQLLSPANGMLLRRVPRELEEYPTGILAAASVAREDRRTAIEQLSSDEKQSLLQKQRVFFGLAPARQQAMRDLHQAIQTDPAVSGLLATAARYARWLGRVDWDQQIELASLSSKERIHRISQMQKHEEKRHDRHRLRDDLRMTLRFLGHFAVKHQREVIQYAPHLKRRGRADSDAMRAGLIMAMIRHWHDTGEPKDPDLDAHAMNKLLRGLSLETQSDIKGVSGAVAQWDALRRLLQSAFTADLSPSERQNLEKASDWERLEVMLQQGHQPPPPKRDAADESELWDLFNERLSDEERTELEQLSREEILERLREYRHQHYRSGAGDRGRGDPPRRRHARPGSPRGGPPPRYGEPEDFDAEEPFDFRRPPPRER